MLCVNIYPNQILPMRKIKEIIVHCTATVATLPVTVETLRDWHVRQRGFSDVGYHFIIDQEGIIHPGRPIEMIGAHCKGRNSESIGVCYIGGLDPKTSAPADTRTPAQKKALVELCTKLCIDFDLSKCDIRGHYEFAAKECPCFKIELLRDEIPLLF